MASKRKKPKAKIGKRSVDRGLRLEYRKASELRANPHNWRKHSLPQRKALQSVIDEVGWAGALLYNERTERLIDGHLRQEISNNGDTVPVLVGSWTEDEERLILATLDPIGAMARTDKDAITALLETVETNDESIQSLLDNLPQPSSLDLAKESVLGYHLADVYAPKLAYRIEAAWRARGTLALELFAGSGQLSDWYRRRFRDVVTNDREQSMATDWHETAKDWLEKHLQEHSGFTFIDFDDEGTPLEEIDCFFGLLSAKRRAGFVLALTDGFGKSLKYHGRRSHILWPGGGRSTTKDYHEYEARVTEWMGNRASGAGWVGDLWSSIRSERGSVLYQTWWFGRACKGTLRGGASK